MKRINSILILAAIFLMSASSIQAQASLKQFMKKAESAYKNQNYNAVLEYVYNAENLDKPTSRTTFLKAEAARHSYAYKLAESSYTYLVDTIKSTEYPESSFYLGDTKHTLGKYEEAIRYYDLFLSENDDNQLLAPIARKQKASAQWAMSQPRNQASLDSVLHMSTDINSIDGDYAPFHDGNNFYFTSLRYDLPKSKIKDKISKVLSGEESDFDPMKEMGLFNSPNKLTSGTSISKDGKLMFTTICERSSLGRIQCKIYYLKKTEDGWSNPELVSGEVNQKGATSTHPAIGESVDGNTRLYFSSDRAGGTGMLDLYSVLYDEDMKFSTVVELADVNTGGNDITPFFHEETYSLFFSSDARNGFGDLDVYERDSNGNIKNIGYGINTSFNDFYYSIAQDESSQYVSSNRPGSLFSAEKFETCCYDIYEKPFEKCSVNLLALTYDDITKAELTGVELTIENLTTGVVEVLDINTLGNDYNYELYCKHNYKITAQKEGYHPTSITIDKSELSSINGGGLELEKKLYLTPTVLPIELLVSTFERPTNFDLLGATVIVIDQETGEEIARIENNPTNEFRFDALQGKKYKLIASKEGYDPEEAMVSIPKDHIGTYRKDMYLGREAVIETLANLIPLRLYYDNDQPNPRTEKVTTDERFRDRYRQYYARKDIFVKNYSELFAGSGYQAAKDEMESFFRDEVKFSHDNLTIFLETLNRILLTGKKVNLYLRGYASPLSRSDYNTALGKRRVDCVRNEFKDYENGILMKYINSGQLIITERSFGEDTANKGISDDPRSPVKSIYSPQASRERRVEIDEILEVK